MLFVPSWKALFAQVAAHSLNWRVFMDMQNFCSTVKAPVCVWLTFRWHPMLPCSCMPATKRWRLSTISTLIWNPPWSHRELKRFDIDWNWHCHHTSWGACQGFQLLHGHVTIICQDPESNLTWSIENSYCSITDGFAERWKQIVDI